MKLKGTGPRRPGSSETEPNFYIMPFLETPALGMEAKEAPRGTTTNSSAALATDLTKNVGRSTPQESTAAMFGPCSYSSILPSPSIETLLQYCGLPSSNAASVSPSYMRLPSCSCRSVLPPSSMEALLLYQGYGLPSSNLASAPTSYVAALSSQVDAHNTIYGNSNAASLTSFLSSKTTLGLPSSFSQGNMSVSPTLAQALFMQSEAHRRRAAAAVRSPAVDVVLANEYWHQPVARGATNQSAAAAEL